MCQKWSQMSLALHIILALFLNEISSKVCQDVKIDIVNLRSAFIPEDRLDKSAGFANDGDTCQVNRKKCGTSTEADDAAWILNFKRPTNLNFVKIAGYIIGDQESISLKEELRLKILYRKKSSHWITCNEKVGPGALETNQITADCLAKGAVQLKLQRLKAGILILCEVEVFVKQCTQPWAEWGQWSPCYRTKTRECFFNPCKERKKSTLCDGAAVTLEYCTPDMTSDFIPEAKCGVCSSAYIFKGIEYSGCTQEDNGGNGGRSWCSITEDFDRDKRWIFCSSGSTWTPWTFTTCKAFRRRKCVGNPADCTGNSEERKNCALVCSKPPLADVTFLIDSTHLLKRSAFETHVKYMVKSILKYLLAGKDSHEIAPTTRTSAILYDATIKSEWLFATSQNLSQLLEAVDAMKFMGNGISDVKAINYVKTTTNNDVRDGVPHIVLHMLPGTESLSSDQLNKEVKNFKQLPNHPTYYPVAVTGIKLIKGDVDYHRKQFRLRASGPDFVTTSPTYDTLRGHLVNIGQVLCNISRS